jgi:hypothetical protein
MSNGSTNYNSYVKVKAIWLEVPENLKENRRTRRTGFKGSGPYSIEYDLITENAYLTFTGGDRQGQTDAFETISS